MKTPPGGKPPKKTPRTAKDVALDAFRANPNGETLTTDQGVGIPQTNDSLKAGLRGPTLLEDFHLREKITRFDHERIPERVVHVGLVALERELVRELTDADDFALS